MTCQSRGGVGEAWPFQVSVRSGSGVKEKTTAHLWLWWLFFFLTAADAVAMSIVVTTISIINVSECRREPGPSIPPPHKIGFFE